MTRTRQQLQQIVADGRAALELIGWALSHKVVDDDLKIALHAAHDLAYSAAAPATTAAQQRRAEARSVYHAMMVMALADEGRIGAASCCVSDPVLICERRHRPAPREPLS